MDIWSAAIQIVKWALLVVFLGLVITGVVQFLEGAQAINDGMTGMVAEVPRWGANTGFQMLGPYVGSWQVRDALVSFTVFLAGFAVTVAGWRLLSHFLAA